MNCKQRMIAAIQCRPVDRLPVTTYNFHPFEGGWWGGEDKPYALRLSYRPMLDAVLETNTGMLCKVSAEWKGERQERRTVERKKGKGGTSRTVTRLHTPKGELTSIFEKPEGQPGYIVEPLVKGNGDLEKYLSFPNEPSVPDLSSAKELCNELGDKGLAYLSYRDPMAAVHRLFDFQDFSMRCVEEFSLIKELVDREFERIRVELERMLHQAEGHDFLFYTGGPEVLTPPMSSPEVFEQLVTPYHRELGEIIRDAGHLQSIHCHGKVKAVFDQFLKIGNHVLEPMEPLPQGDITLQEAWERAEGKMCLMGYVQDQDLYTAEPGEMREKVRFICELMRGKNGYIMTNTATPYMSPPPKRFVRNYVEFVRAAAEYGDG